MANQILSINQDIMLVVHEIGVLLAVARSNAARQVNSNKILRAYVLIKLKTTKLTPEAAGQINLYLNNYASEVNDPDDNPPIGIILCTEKDSITAEYALGGLSNKIFASRYVLVMPDKEQLIAQVEEVLEKRNESDSGSKAK